MSLSTHPFLWIRNINDAGYGVILNTEEIIIEADSLKDFSHKLLDLCFDDNKTYYWMTQPKEKDKKVIGVIKYVIKFY